MPFWVFWLPAIATAALIAWLSHQPKLPEIPGAPGDWFLHGLAYGFFTLTCVYGTTRGLEREYRLASRVVAAVLIASLYGVTDEWHQSFVGRDATVGDWVSDTVGAVLMAVVVLISWRWLEPPESGAPEGR